MLEYGFDFLSRHKEKCRKKIVYKGSTDFYYELSNHYIKDNGTWYMCCNTCDYKVMDNYPDCG